MSGGTERRRIEAGNNLRWDTGRRGAPALRIHRIRKSSRSREQPKGMGGHDCTLSENKGRSKIARGTSPATK